MNGTGNKYFIPILQWMRAIAAFLSACGFSASARDLQLYRHGVSGQVVFARVTNIPSGPSSTSSNLLRQPNAAAVPITNAVADPGPIADAFLIAHRSAIGIEQEISSLARVRSARDKLGMSHVHYDQFYQGIPVFGAEAIVHVDTDDRVRSLSVDVLPGLQPNVHGTISASAAVVAAQALWQSQFGKANALVATMRQCIFAPALVYHDKSTNAWLVWEVKMKSRAHQTQNYFIDASTGALRYQTTETFSLDRFVFDCSAEPGSGICDCSFTNSTDFANVYVFGRTEGSPADGPNPRLFPQEFLDDDNAYDYFGQLLTMYQDVLGRNGGNDLGGTGDGVSVPASQSVAKTFLDYLDSASCPNSFFAQGTLEFCKGELAPDVFAHEYGHAVPYFSILDVLGEPGGMLYEGETGALNENYADVSGEMFEAYVWGASDWLEGFTTLYGPIRSLSDPPAIPAPPFFYADRFQSPHFFCESEDRSGVHLKSTVPSKAAYLLSEGGQFNGCTISPIGPDKVYQIWYRAMTVYYSRTETFNGAMPKLIESARDLYPDEPATVLSVQRALQAVEMDQAGTCSGKPGTVPLALDLVGW